MKLNHDLVRYVLLSIESSNQVSGPTEDELMMEVKKYGSYIKMILCTLFQSLKKQDLLLEKYIIQNIKKNLNLCGWNRGI